MQNVTRLLWQVTGVAVVLAVLGFLLIGVSATNDGGDSGAVGVVGVIALVVGLALGVYAAWQWLRYSAARSR